MALTVREEHFDSVQDEWEQILPECLTNTIFVTPQLQKLWWGHFGQQSELRILSVRDGNELLGIAPLMCVEGVLSFVGDRDLFDYQDFVVRQGREAEFFGILSEYLVNLRWHRLELTSVPQGSPTLDYIPGLADGTGVTVEVREEDVTPVVPLPSTWDEYVAALGKKDRHELRRKLRRLERAGNAHQSMCDDKGAFPGCMQDFFRLLRASSPEKSRFLTPQRERFFEDFALELSTRGQLRLYFLQVDGVRVASCICFDYGGAYLLYNSGYDPDYASLSVGLINKALCIREAIEAGRRSFNFLKGTERYKYDLGGRNTTVYELVVRR